MGRSGRDWRWKKRRSSWGLAGKVQWSPQEEKEQAEVLKWKTKDRAPRRERTAGELRKAQGKEQRAGMLNQDPRWPTRGCGRVKEKWKTR